jgi:hypothetical protein
MPTFSERATLLRDTERLLKLVILYNDDDSNDVEKNENMVLFYPCSMKKKGESSFPQVDDISTNPQVDTM